MREADLQSYVRCAFARNRKTIQGSLCRPHPDAQIIDRYADAIDLSDAAIAVGEITMHGSRNGRFWLADRPDDYN